MELKPGTWVRNPREPSWGTGRIECYEEDKVRVLFPEVGEKLLNIRFVTLEESQPPANAETLRLRLRVRTGINMESLQRLCELFHEQFKTRRSNTDDGVMAMNVLEDMKVRGDLTGDSAGQLFSWCHTGASYAEGVDLAQQICRLIYGRVPTRAEVEAAGF
jgi:Protein of unknown function (DUF3553)